VKLTAKEKEEYRDAFRASYRRRRSVRGRLEVIYDAACSGLWKKCKGTYSRGSEQRCFTGLVLDLAGIVNPKGGFDLVVSESYKWEEMIGFDPFEDALMSDATLKSGESVGGRYVYEVNDDTDAKLCEIAELAKSQMVHGS
jgi:hypothetical protein